MSEIICTCGHGIGLHDNDICGGFERLLEPLCKCRLSSEAVEARDWARKMMKERDKLKATLYDQHIELDETRHHYVEACVQRSDEKRKHILLQDEISWLQSERDALQAKLDAYMQLVKTTIRVDKELCDTLEVAREILHRLSTFDCGFIANNIIAHALAKLDRLDSTMKDTNHDLNNQGISLDTGGARC